MNADIGPNILAKIKKKKKTAKWLVEWNGRASHEVFFDNLVLDVRE